MAYLSTIAQGLTWAADHGARVANISYTVYDSSTVISAANYFRSKGGVVASSAGNTGALSSTAATSSMFVVAATDGNDVPSLVVHLRAGGENIWRPVRDLYDG